MSAEEQILERLARIEEKMEQFSVVADQLTNITNIFENFHDLGRDISLLSYPTVKVLTEELGEVETGFQLEDITFLFKRFLLSLRHIAWGLEQLENLVDWWQDMEPIMKIAVPHLIDVLEDLDQKGIFRGYQAMLQGYAKIAQKYGPEDIDLIADGIVSMHGVAKKFTDPKFIQFVEKFMDVPTQVNLEEAKPTGPMGLMWRMRSQESRRGLGVLAELTKALGKLANHNGNGKTPAAGEEGGE
jgi:uncharacterized protein YjgD (DUF1641 family)|uniref:DUF1641 domain-containing protein n=1 Tax=Desulfobacca acetoxidans TaxID=60893 RepID=A0A7V6A4D2_9BACT